MVTAVWCGVRERCGCGECVYGCMGGTRGSGVLSSTGDVLEMTVLRGVGGLLDVCVCVLVAVV